MDLSKLQLLNTDLLMRMREEIDKILKTRLDTEIRVGRTARFTCSSGIERIVVIERVNGKSISAMELAHSHSPRTKWRLTRGLLRVDPIVIQTASSAVAAKPAAKPQTETDNAW